MSGTSPLDESRKTGVDALPTTSDDNQRRGNAQSPPVHVQDVQGNFEVMGDFESDDRGITRELVSPSLGETESWIGVVQFIQSQPQDAGLSDSDTI